jgi:hypothetical protein
MSYTKAIAIQHGGTINMGVADTEILNSEYLSDFDLHSINQIVTDLDEVINNPNGALIWGQMQIMIDSDPINSKCADQMSNEILPDVLTISFLNLMMENKKFKEHYQNHTNLKDIIGQAFTTIKANPNNFKRWPTSNIVFSITLNEIFVSLVLVPEDFNLTETEYVNQLKTNF